MLADILRVFNAHLDTLDFSQEPFNLFGIPFTTTQLETQKNRLHFSYLEQFFNEERGQNLATFLPTDEQHFVLQRMVLLEALCRRTKVMAAEGNICQICNGDIRFRFNHYYGSKLHFIGCLGMKPFMCPATKCPLGYAKMAAFWRHVKRCSWLPKELNGPEHLEMMTKMRSMGDLESLYTFQAHMFRKLGLLQREIGQDFSIPNGLQEQPHLQNIQSRADKDCAFPNPLQRAILAALSIASANFKKEPFRTAVPLIEDQVKDLDFFWPPKDFLPLVIHLLKPYLDAGAQAGDKDKFRYFILRFIQIECRIKLAFARCARPLQIKSSWLNVGCNFCGFKARAVTMKTGLNCHFFKHLKLEVGRCLRCHDNFFTFEEYYLDQRQCFPETKIQLTLSKRHAHLLWLLENEYHVRKSISKLPEQVFDPAWDMKVVPRSVPEGRDDSDDLQGISELRSGGEESEGSGEVRPSQSIEIPSMAPPREDSKQAPLQESEAKANTNRLSFLISSCKTKTKKKPRYYCLMNEDGNLEEGICMD